MFKTAKFQTRQRRYQPNLTFDLGGYDYWRLWILAGTALAVLKFGVCGCRPTYILTHYRSAMPFGNRRIYFREFFQYSIVKI